MKRREERCREVRSLLSDHVDDELEPGERARLDRHLRWCPSCRRMLGNLGRAVSGLRRLGTQAPRR